MDSQSQGDFLTKEEILGIIDKLSKNKNKKDEAGGAKKGKKKGGEEENDEDLFNKIRTAGEEVWIKNVDCGDQVQGNKKKPFYKVRVIEDLGKQISCKLVDGEESEEPKFKQARFDHDKKLIMDNSKMAEDGIQDMINIDELNHATVLYNLYQRYKRKQIYTYVGPTLLAVNPFEAIKGKEKEEYYRITNAKSNYHEVMQEMDAHSYAISAYAQAQMLHTKVRQAIVISGESGAGKTESARQCMAFLTSFGDSGDGDQAGQPSIGDRILNTNPVLEAFGNSKTARNNNSSRFGKYTVMYFDIQTGQVLGAKIKNYLLEKSRVTGSAKVERNYHAYFFMMRGCDDNQAKQLGFVKPDGKTRTDAEDFNYLRNFTDLENGMEKDKREYDDLIKAFKTLGFSEEEQKAIHSITAASLHIGELVLDNSTYVETKTPVSIKNKDKLKQVADLLGIKNPSRLEEEIVNKEAIKGISTRTPLRPDDVEDSVKTLAKALYNNMFDWLVKKMNIEILPDDIKSGDEGDIQKFDQKTKTIGLLDIFGFECFEENRFEQICINFVNEKLHNLYISSVFGSEKDEMKRENLDIKLKLPDMKVRRVLLLMNNQLKTPQTPLGLFEITDEKSRTNVGNKTAKQRLEELYKLLCQDRDKTSPGIFEKEKKGSGKQFTIHHSAKSVTYDCSNFIDRNADAMSKSMNDIIVQESDDCVKKIFQKLTGFEKEDENDDPKAKKGGAPAAKTIWSAFKLQIIDLMNELAEPLIPQDLNDDAPPQETKSSKKNEPVCPQTDLHFIRCLKPNDDKKPNRFYHAMTLQQITYMGVLESIRVKQENFPYRYKYEDFYKYFELLSPAYVEGRYDLMTADQKSSKKWNQLVEQIINRVFQPLAPESFQDVYYALGRTKIMMHAEAKCVVDASLQKASFEFDKRCKYIKRAYSLMKAQEKIRLMNLHLKRCQKKAKKHYQIIQKRRADEFHQKIMAAFVKFKTEKRKDFEMEAAAVIEHVYYRHVFREHLHQSIMSRKFMMSGIYNAATINRCRKMWICRRMTMKIFEQAFDRAKKIKEEQQVFRIQRILRGYIERADKKELVLNAVKMKVELKQHVSAKKIQKTMKGLLVRRRLDYLNKKVSVIQAQMKAKWTRRVFQVIKRNTITLQKAYRRYMARRDQIKIRLYRFLEHELQVMENVKAMEFAQLHGNNLSRIQAQQMGLLKTLTPYSIKKIHFFTRVIDLNILVDLSEIYTHPWSAQWIKSMAESTFNDCPILSVNTGQTHSMAVNSRGKVYVWGWNDNGQCGQPITVDEVILNQQNTKNANIALDHILDDEKQIQIKNQGGMRIKQAVAVQDRCMLLIQETNEVVCWGGNERGQLGLGHYEDVSTPQKIDVLAKSDIKISYIAAGGDLNLACSEKGEAFAWPFVKFGIKQSIPTKMPFSEKTKIQKVSCGHNFGFFISNQGLVYSFGEDNQDGQLGLGHIYPTEFPELIHCFKDVGERIDTIECGFKHAIAKSTLGKVYTWGSSNKGQLGHEHMDSELSPRPLLIDKQNNKKASQVAAGYSHCMVMLDSNKEIYWFGTCGNLIEQLYPIQFDFARYMPDLFGPQDEQLQKANIGNQDDGNQFTPYILGSQQQDFAIVKINSSWSKSMSITSMLIADLRAVNQDIAHSKLVSTLKTLNSKWDPHDIMPPYIDHISGMFPANIMRKPAILSSSSGLSSSTAGSKKKQPPNISQLVNLASKGAQTQRGQANRSNMTSGRNDMTQGKKSARR